MNFASCKRDLNNEWIGDYDGRPILAQNPPGRRETRSERPKATNPNCRGGGDFKEVFLNSSIKYHLVKARRGSILLR